MLQMFYKGKAGKSMEPVDEFRAGTWLLVESPTEDERQLLIEKFKVDEGLLQDALDPFEVPRIERDGDITYMYTRVPVRKNGEIATTPVLVMLGSNFLAVVTQEKNLEIWKPFISGKQAVNTTQKTNFFLQIFTEVNRVFQRYLTTINREVRGTSVNLERIRNQDIVKFVRFEQTLNDFLGALIPTNTALEQIVSGKHVRLYEDDRDLIEDLSLSAEQLIELAKSNLRTIVNVRNAYSTIMTNNLNRVIKLLTTITILLTVPTMLAGLFGMNVVLPFSPDDPRSFWVVVALSILGALVVYMFTRERN